MAEFNDTYRKAGLLMSSALKKYNNGNFEGGDKDREEANRLYDIAQQELNSEQRKTSMLYGENRNFGIIYKIFESNAPLLFNDKQRKSDIKKVLKLIKENKVLKKEFDIYKSFSYPETVSNPSEYVNEAISLIPLFEKDKIIENNEKLINLIKKLNLNEMVELTDDEFKLFEAIEYVMLNKKTFNNINDYSNAKSYIIEHVKNISEQINEKHETKTVDEVYDETINEIADKYDDILNETEKKMINELSIVEDKETYFNTEKNKTIEILKNYITECNDEDKDNLNKIIESITNQKYSESDFISNIAEFKEIKDTINGKEE